MDGILSNEKSTPSAILALKEAATAGKIELESIITEQQTSLLKVVTLHGAHKAQSSSEPELRTLNLYQYQAHSLRGLDASEVKVSTVCDSSKSYLEHLLQQWTWLALAARRAEQQPTVESEPESDAEPSLEHAPQVLSIPVSNRVSDENEEEELGLGIPWTLRSSKHYWDYVDKAVVKTNAKLSSPKKLVTSRCTTVISEAWVHPDAIKNCGFPYTRVQRFNEVDQKTILETVLIIDQILTFEQVEKLVEHTIEIFRSSSSNG